MSTTEYLEIEPFEICSIRPPTENYSLTFRLTRNCYWNRCRFCQVYKYNFKFSRRMEDEILKDVERAKKFDEGIPSDIHEEIAPFVKSGSLDLSCAKNEKLKRMIKLVREKLMP